MKLIKIGNTGVLSSDSDRITLADHVFIDSAYLDFINSVNQVWFDLHSIKLIDCGGLVVLLRLSEILEHNGKPKLHLISPLNSIVSFFELFNVKDSFVIVKEIPLFLNYTLFDCER